MSVIHALNNFSQLASARVVQLTNLAGVYFNGPTNNGVGATLTAASAAALTIDSVAVEEGDRVLLMGQTLGYQNGLYEVLEPGSASALWQLQRTGDFQCMEQLQLGANVYIFAGTVNAGACFVLTEPLPAAIGVPVVAGSNDINFTASPLNSALGTAAALDASDAGLPTLASVDGATVIGNLAEFSDIAGTVTDSGVATADVQLSANIIAATTADIGGGGPGPISVVVAGLTAASVVVATVEASTNPVSVIACTATATGFDITFSADPGAACTVNYVAFVAAQ